MSSKSSASSGELTNFDLMRYFTNKKTGLPYKKFGGIYSKDELADITPENKFYIVNMDDSKGPGSHWVLVYNCRPKQIMYFDSYGVPPPEEVLRFMRRARTSGTKSDRSPRKKLFYNTLQIQTFDDDHCGYYVAYVAKMLMDRRSFLDIILDFQDGFKRWRNDDLIDKIKKSRYVQEFSRDGW